MNTMIFYTTPKTFLILFQMEKESQAYRIANLFGQNKTIILKPRIPETLPHNFVPKN